MPDGNGIQPLSNFQKNLPKFTTIGGTVLMLLAMGIQNAAQSNPELLKDWGSTEDLTKMAGAIITLMGIALAHGNDKTNTHAIEQAAKAAPIDKDGNQSSTITAGAAVEQAINEGNHPLAKRLLEALSPSGPSEKIGNLSGFPASEPERSVA
jgi:hypothetical protein